MRIASGALAAGGPAAIALALKQHAGRGPNDEVCIIPGVCSFLCVVI